MKKHLIIDTKGFNGPVDYIAKVKHLDDSVSWDAIITWRDLCTALGINREVVAGGKARPAIDKVAKELNEETKEAKVEVEVKKEAEPKKEVRVKAERKSVATKVKVEIPQEVEVKQVEAPEVEDKSFVVVEVEEKKQPAVVKNVEEVARRISEALNLLSVQSGSDETDLLQLRREFEGLNDRLSALEQQNQRIMEFFASFPVSFKN